MPVCWKCNQWYSDPFIDNMSYGEFVTEEIDITKFDCGDEELHKYGEEEMEYWKAYYSHCREKEAEKDAEIASNTYAFMTDTSEKE
jgi:hypothetical protein